MTPRELAGWLGLARGRRRTQLAEALAVAALGAQGKGEDIKRQIKEWAE
jgi:hypothetical protein